MVTGDVSKSTSVPLLLLDMALRRTHAAAASPPDSDGSKKGAAGVLVVVVVAGGAAEAHAAALRCALLRREPLGASIGYRHLFDAALPQRCPLESVALSLSLSLEAKV